MFNATASELASRPGGWLGAREWPWLITGALLYLSFGFTEMMGSDLWWHLAAGREILQLSSVWLFDDWSYTELGNPWYNHEWLADVLFYVWARCFGVASLVIWKWALITASFCLLQRLLGRLAANPASALLASVVAALLAAPFLDLRPHLYTLLGTVALLNLTLLRKPRLAQLLPLFLLWANLHGGFVFGLMLLGILLFPWRDLTLASSARAGFTWLCCAAVCLVNPHGLQIFWLPLVYALNADSPYRGLAEWRSPFEPGGIASPLYAYSLVVAAGLGLTWVLPRVRRQVMLRPELLAMVALTGAMSLTSRRFIVLWAIAFALLLAPFAATLFRQRLLQPLLLPLLGAVFVWAALRLAPYPLQPAVAYHYLTAEYAYPEGLVEFVGLNELQGNTFAYYNWGGYLHWHTDGALKVFIDGRANTLFEDSTYLDYLSVLRRRPGWIELIERSGAGLFLWPRASGGERLVRELRATGRWRLLYEDARGVLLAHQSFETKRSLKVPKNTVSRDVTLAMQALRRQDYATAVLAANRARDRTPWDWSACTYLKMALRASGETAEAATVLSQCRQWFPSRYLR